MSTLKVVEIGGWAVSNNPEDILRTYALGSCIALILHHPMTKTMGLVHIALPSPLCHDRKNRREGFYAGSAVPLLLNEVRAMAGLYSAEGSGIVAKLAGGAAVIKTNNPFHLGERLRAEIQRILLRFHIPTVKQDTGGTVSRTVSLYVGSGNVTVKYPGTEEKNL